TLGGGQADVSQKLLDGPEVRPAGQQVSGKRVPQRVRARAMGQGDRLDPTGDDVANASVCQSTPAEVDEERVRARSGSPASRKIGPKGGLRPAPEEHDPLFAALAEDSHHASAEIDVVEVEPDQL